MKYCILQGWCLLREDIDDDWKSYFVTINNGLLLWYNDIMIVIYKDSD
jgi:hypothetical protein